MIFSLLLGITSQKSLAIKIEGKDDQIEFTLISKSKVVYVRPIEQFKKVAGTYCAYTKY